MTSEVIPRTECSRIESWTDLNVWESHLLLNLVVSLYMLVLASPCMNKCRGVRFSNPFRAAPGVVDTAPVASRESSLVFDPNAVPYGGLQSPCLALVQYNYYQLLFSSLLDVLSTNPSPACAAWPPCPCPRLLGRADALLRQLHHRWRCLLFRRAFDQTQRNRMREKVTASVLFKGRKALYARSVPHPFVGDYVRLRASGSWRRGLGAPQAADRYVVFADVVRKLRAQGAGGARRLLAVLSTHALLLLDARSLRLRRRVPAHQVYRLSLSPFADDLLLVHVRAVSGARRRGDLALRSCHVLELATKLFLVVQNACGAPPHVTVAPQFEASLGGQPVAVAFHAPPDAPHESRSPRLLRRGSRLDVLL
ncbi:unconventional myosin-Ia-like [Hyposmocoma kahamanoa]|uniref:unconventional myosin-Ia-like n=1 Tax=Hyposmocoma kahamanoa TaxID=1477025 RepID=UPI000E6D64C4|nr:unconventional myosin-Ia-like [Hyposmocoma kahamanoa]